MFFSAQENAVYELERNVTVEVMCKNYPEFNASYWTLYFENKSDSNSQVISDILDCETLQRSIPFFRSDYQCNFNEEPDVLQVHNSNISCYLPYNGCTSKTKNDTYAIRSSYSSSWGGAFYNAIFQSMNEEDFKWAKNITDEYRRIREYFSKDFYNHGSSTFDNTAWTIWQYHDSETQSGIVMAFRRCESPFEQVSINLIGLDENKTYIYQNLDSGILTEGADELWINLLQKRSCTIIEYKLK